MIEQVVDGWVNDLTTEVADLAGAIVHRYAPWSPELFHAAVGETHVAVYPLGDPDNAAPFATGSLPTDLLRTRFEADAWHGAVAEDQRFTSNEADDLAWVRTFEAVRARFYVQANATVGGIAGPTRYVGGRMGTINGCRFLTVTFDARWYISFT